MCGCISASGLTTSVCVGVCARSLAAVRDNQTERIDPGQVSAPSGAL
jgi:hypothetical protein